MGNRIAAQEKHLLTEGGQSGGARGGYRETVSTIGVKRGRLLASSSRFSAGVGKLTRVHSCTRPPDLAAAVAKIDSEG